MSKSQEITREQFIGGRAPAMGREIRLPLARLVRSFGPPCKTAANAWDVFLPCAGYRDGSSSGADGTAVKNVGTNGNYWSSVPNGSNAWNMNFNASNVNMNSNNRNNARCVRPVRVSEHFSLVFLKYENRLI